MKHKSQSGRSMVEMLGTLAIIGVLSMGGITGYSYAMDKYRANQTINDINLRTVDLLIQASQGRPELSLAEWEKANSIYDFTNPAYSDDGLDLIMFDVGATKKMPKSVCQMVFNGLVNNAIQIDINAARSNSNEDCGEDNTMTFYFKGVSGNTTGDEAPSGEQCGDTICDFCQICEDDGFTLSCIPIPDYDITCTTGDKTGWCISGTCTVENTCNCGPGQYCADKNTAGGSSTHPTPSGTCVDAKSQFSTLEIEGTTYYISNEKMSWWDAASACATLGNKNFVTSDDLIRFDTGEDPDDDYWDYVYTPLHYALYDRWGNSDYPAIWSSAATFGGAYYLNLDGSSDGSARHFSDYYVVCK